MEKVKGKLLNSIIIALVFAFNLCVFGPLEFYYSNVFDFWFTLDYVLPAVCIVGVVVFGISFCILYFTKEKISRFLCRITFLLMTALYVQGNYLNIGYDVLDGSTVNWKSMIFKGIINAIIWGAILVIPFFIKLFKEDKVFIKVSNIISLFILGIEIITLSVLIFMVNVYSADTNSVLDSSFYLDSSKMFEISEEENIIVFVSDTFEATYMNDILEKYPEYKDKLKDFTYFDNTTGASLMTYSAMPTILTGETCQVGNNLKENIDYCFDNSKLFDVLIENGYDVELYTDMNLIPAGEERISNKIDKKIMLNGSSKFKLAELLYECVMYKYLPHFLKSGFVVDTAEFNRITSTEVEQYGFDDVKFYETLIEKKISTLNSNKKYKLYHLNGVHTPYTITNDIKYDLSKEYLAKDIQERRENQTIASLNIFINYLENLRKTNVYDNTTIILIADHGWENRYHINCLVKNKNADSEFSISHAPISIAEDFVPTILNVATNSKNYGKDIFDYKEDEIRKRDVYNYTFTRGDNTYNVLSKVVVSTDTNASNVDGYYISDTEYLNSEKVPEKEYEFGKEINIGKSKNMKYIVLNGILENNIRTILKGTNIGKDAKLKILTNNANNDVNAEITISKVYYDNQKLIISTGEKILFEESLNVLDSGKTIKFSVPKNIWNTESVLEINLEFPDGKLGNPSALGEETLFMSMVLDKIIFYE